MLQCKNLAVGYKKNPIIKNINFELTAGESIALVGANGSGKTTILKTIASLLKPLEGLCKINGKDSAANLPNIAYLSQFNFNNSNLPLKAIDIVRMGRFAHLGLLGIRKKEDEDKVHEALEVMQITKLANKILSEMSGGQRQRVFLAQTLARGAKLILLDEPASNLDMQAINNYRAVFATLKKKGCSLIIATHDIEEAQQCDYSMLLAHEVISFGPSAEAITPAALFKIFGHIGKYSEGCIVPLSPDHDHE